MVLNNNTSNDTYKNDIEQKIIEFAETIFKKKRYKNYYIKCVTEIKRILYATSQTWSVDYTSNSEKYTDEDKEHDEKNLNAIVNSIGTFILGIYDMTRFNSIKLKILFQNNTTKVSIINNNVNKLLLKIDYPHKKPSLYKKIKQVYENKEKFINEMKVMGIFIFGHNAIIDYENYYNKHYCGLTAIGILNYLKKEYGIGSITDNLTIDEMLNTIDKSFNLLYYISLNMGAIENIGNNDINEFKFPGHVCIIEKNGDDYYLHQSFVNMYSYDDWLNTHYKKMNREEVTQLFNDIKMLINIRDKNNNAKKRSDIINKSLENITKCKLSDEIIITKNSKIDDNIFTPAYLFIMHHYSKEL